MKHFNLIIIILIVLSFITALFVQGEIHNTAMKEVKSEVVDLKESNKKLKKSLKLEESKRDKQKTHYEGEIARLKEARATEAKNLNAQIDTYTAKVGELEQSLAAKTKELNDLKKNGFGRGGIVTQPTMQAVNGANNGYAFGNCTYHAKNLRPDLPNNLGNANTWLPRAQAMGLPTGSEPRVGAIAATSKGYYGHVAVVTGVSGNTVHVSEMNAVGFNVVSTASYDKSYYDGYIY